MATRIEPLQKRPDQAKAPLPTTEKEELLHDVSAEQPADTNEQTGPKDEEPGKSKELLHDFADDEERARFLGQLIESKKYFVNIKQKAYRKGTRLTLGFNLHKDRAKHDLVKASQHTEEATATKKSTPKKADGNRRNAQIAVVIVIWIGMFIGIDTGLLNIGWEPPFSILGGSDNSPAQEVQLNAESI